MSHPAYFDCHCDTLGELFRNPDASLLTGAPHVRIDDMCDYDHYVQFCAIFSNMGAYMQEQCKSEEEFNRKVQEGGIVPTPAFYEHYEALIRIFNEQAAKYPDRLRACRSVADIDQARKEGKPAVVLTMEGSEQLGETSVEDAYRRGIRACTLTWNYANTVGGTQVTGGGLTDYGVEFLRRCEDVGMLVDVSHSSEALFYDVARLCRKPFIASHSNARHIGRHRRNLTDEQFLAICRAGGVAGLNLYASFIKDEGTCTIDDCCEHIEYFLTLGGAKHIAMGADLDGCSTLPEGIDGSGDVWKIADRLAKRKVPLSVIEDIFYNNIYRVCKEVWK